jgi:hypothetical protein
VRRIIVGLMAFLALAGTILVLPVYAAPVPETRPVAPSIDQVALGSVEMPAGGAVVTTDGEPVAEQAAVSPGGAPDDPTVESEPVPAAGTEVPTSGDELPGVPALTISEPETDDFSTVGVTWAADASVTDVVVQARVREVGGGWGEWTFLEEDDVEAPEAQVGMSATRRSGTIPYFTGPARGIEVIVQAADGRTPQDVRLQLIDPGSSPADTALGAAQVQDQASAAAAMPAIYSRAQWGADESLRTWDPSYSPTVKAASIHHTAGSNSYTADQVPSLLRSIYAYHAVSRGWGDIGYNFLVDKFGRAWEGRYSGDRGPSSPIVGAHTGGFNGYTFGISMMGDYEKAPTTSAMVETVAAVAAWKLSLYGVEPSGWTTLTSAGGGTSRYAAGTSVDVPSIFAHRDVGTTSCSGRYAYAKMDTIRSIASERVAFALAHDPRGHLDSAAITTSGFTVSGWALDPDSTSTSVPVIVSVDGFRMARFTAEAPRPDIAEAYPGAGEAHGYRYSGNLSYGLHTICVTAVNVSGPGSDNVLGCKELMFENVKPQFALDRFVEEADGSVRIQGWAFDGDGSDVRLHVYTNGTGRSYGTGVSRTDVAAAYPAAGDTAGFDIALGPLSGTKGVCVFVIDTVAPGNNAMTSCKSFRYQAPIGSLDEVSETLDGGLRVRGWAFDPSLPTTGLRVHAYVDRTGVSIPASGNRPDIGRHFPEAGSEHGYDTTVSAATGERRVCAYAINVGLVGPHTLMDCRSITLSYIAPQGVVDEVRAIGDGQVRVRGWMFDRSVPTAPVEVHYYVDGLWHSKVVASGSRPDVGHAFPGVGNSHGIDSTLTIGAGRHEVCTFGINVGVAGSNPLVNCTKVTA